MFTARYGLIPYIKQRAFGLKINVVESVYSAVRTDSLYRVIRNDCLGFNNWPPRSPDSTPCDFFLWGYVKDKVYVPPLPASIPELKVRIRTAIEIITADMLQTF